MRRGILTLMTFLVGGILDSTSTSAIAQLGYQKPPKEILDILHAPPTPQVAISPDRKWMLLLESESYPSISEISRPMLRLAGLRINPLTSGQHRPQVYRSIRAIRLSDGSERELVRSESANLGTPTWSPNGQKLALLRYSDTKVELIIHDLISSKTATVPGLRLLTCLGRPLQWSSDNLSLVCQSIPEARPGLPSTAIVPSGPSIQESHGKIAPVRTFQDLLQNTRDEQLFEHHATSQLVVVNAESLVTHTVATPGIFTDVDVSPDGKHLLVVRHLKPFSYLHPVSQFPKEIAIWSFLGKLERMIASLPLEDQVPIEGVPKGPRQVDWIPTQGASLTWVEALDEGDPKKKVSHRDRLMWLNSPFLSDANEVMRLQHRFMGMSWGEKPSLALVRDFNRETKHMRTLLFHPEEKNQESRVIWDRSIQDRYRNPGTPLTSSLSNGKSVLVQEGNAIFLAGQGASARGDTPFLDRFDLSSQKTTRLWQCTDKTYESVVALTASDGSKFVTRRESSTQPPNYYLLDQAGGSKPLTQFTDQFPALRRIKKEIVTYKRKDGVPLSFTLYLPPDYQPGKPLPTVVWAYPREFPSSDNAGQVSGSAHQFTRIAGPSHLFFLLQGYAVLDDATMPVVGDPETVNNTFLDQIVSSGQAAIDKAVELGVTDRDRVGVGGHSYGAFMTANLLAHSQLFRAGIARSGAYNRTLTPFGFQSERRTLWEAKDIYMQLSPFLFAHKLKSPILLIHGEADNNPGTFPIQSERMYQAVRGNGGTVRYVTLPNESHGYQARESIEHTLFEMLAWFDRYVKHAPPRQVVGGDG